MAIQAKLTAALTFLPAGFAFSMLVSVLREVIRLTDLFGVTVQALRGGLVNHDGIADLFIIFDMVN